MRVVVGLDASMQIFERNLLEEIDGFVWDSHFGVSVLIERGEFLVRDHLPEINMSCVDECVFLLVVRMRW